MSIMISLKFKLQLFRARLCKMYYKAHALNSTLEIEKVDFTYTANYIGRSRELFYSTHPEAIIYEPQYYQNALDKILTEVYQNKSKEVTLSLKSYNGSYYKIKWIKKRKTLGYADYCKTAWFLWFLTTVTFPSIHFRRLLLEACRVACKERKRFEKNGGICI